MKFWYKHPLNQNIWETLFVTGMCVTLSVFGFAMNQGCNQFLCELSGPVVLGYYGLLTFGIATAVLFFVRSLGAHDATELSRGVLKITALATRAVSLTMIILGIFVAYLYWTDVYYYSRLGSPPDQYINEESFAVVAVALVTVGVGLRMFWRQLLSSRKS